MTNTKVTEIILSQSTDGQFTLKTNAGEIIKFEDNHLLYAMEEIVYKFRGKKPKFQVLAVDQFASAPVQQKPKPQYRQHEGNSSYHGQDDIASARYNGGLGPQVSSQENWNGFGIPQ